jgi:hypothetical protein
VEPAVESLVEEHGWTVTLAVAAKIAGFDDETVRDLQRRGRFPGHTAKGRTKVFVPDLVEWMRQGGESQYEPDVTPDRRPTHGARIRSRRKSDYPAWMDRVAAPAS